MVLFLNRWIVTDGGLTIAPGTGSWMERVTGSYCSIAYWDGNTSKIIRKLTTRTIPQTNNESEYLALLWGVSKVATLEFKKIGQYQQHKWKDVYVFMDSRLVVNQVNGKWKVKAENLRILNQQVKKNKSQLGFTLMWIPREVVVNILGH